MRRKNFGFWILDFGFGRELSAQAPHPLAQSKIQNPKSKIPRPAFTLTELLVVIAIIAVLASLVTAAAINALNRAKRAAITMELKQLAGSMDNFKNDFGAYPPNGMNPNDTPATTPIARMIQSDFEGMFKNMFPKHQENPELIKALCGQSLQNFNLRNGMTASEAVYFWLGGFSDDELYPISGPRGPSFLVNAGEIIEDRNRKYGFDLGRLRPVDEDGVFDGRSITYPDPKSGDDRRINFWRFHPSGSEQPIIYFDVSRHKPAPLSGPDARQGRYDIWAAKPNPSGGVPAIYALKQKRRGVANVNNDFNNLIFVEQGKCQILHAGLDDDWGQEFEIMGSSEPDGTGRKAGDVVLYPDGPFTNETADTLANFYDGSLEDAQEKK